MPSNHLILCHPFLLLPSIFPSIRVFSNESVLRIRWPKDWSFSFSRISDRVFKVGGINYQWRCQVHREHPTTEQNLPPSCPFWCFTSPLLATSSPGWFSVLLLLYSPTILSLTVPSLLSNSRGLGLAAWKDRPLSPPGTTQAFSSHSSHRRGLSHSSGHLPP